MEPSLAASVARSGEAIAEATAQETAGLLSRLLGPSADVIGADWADRLRQQNLARLLRKTERRAAGNPNAGYTKPRIAAAVFDAAQYSDDEMVAEYLSGLLSTSRSPDGGDDGALPWTNLVSRMSTLQLRIHFVIYSNLRQIIKADDQHERLFDYEDRDVMFPLPALVSAVGLPTSAAGVARFSDAMYGLKQEGLLESYSYGDRSFFNERFGNRSWAPKRHLTTPYDQVLEITFTLYGVRLFSWGVGCGHLDDAAYLDQEVQMGFIEEPDGVQTSPLADVNFSETYWAAGPDPEAPVTQNADGSEPT